MILIYFYSIFFFISDQQKEFTNDCVFNERLLDNYNYYTSTYHSTTMKTFYLALNRLGAPRKTHIPSNKPLGKLSSYVRSITLTVPEARADGLLARSFGANHVKHGLKHLCTSNKALHELTAKTLLIPKCNSDRMLATATVTTTLPTVRLRHRPLSAGESNGHRRHQHKCINEPCPKKNRKSIRDKTAAAAATATSPAPHIKTLMSRFETANVTNRTSPSPKQKKKVKHKHNKTRKHSPTPSIKTTTAIIITTTTTTTASTTKATTSMPMHENVIGDDNDDGDDDAGTDINDELSHPTGPTAVSSDADYDYGYDK